MIPVEIRPTSTPPSTTASSVIALMSASGLSMYSPGMVKATPPATIAPADMAVCVTLISLMFVLPSALRENMDTSATKMIGQGKAPSLSATYMELVVRMTAPRLPMIIPRIVSCCPIETAVALRFALFFLVVFFVIFSPSGSP